LIEQSNLASDKTYKIEKLIDSIFDAPNIRAIVVSDENGLPVASKIFTQEADDIELIISAVISTLINTGAKISEQLKLGLPSNLMMYLEDGMLMIQLIHDRACCGLILPSKKYVNIPYFEIKLTEFAKKIKPILFPDEEV